MVLGHYKKKNKLMVNLRHEKWSVEAPSVSPCKSKKKLTEAAINNQILLAHSTTNSQQMVESLSA
jgi:hypothetical protein